MYFYSVNCKQLCTKSVIFTEIQHLSQHLIFQSKSLKLETYESCQEHVVGGVVVLVGLKSDAESKTPDDPRKHQPMTEKEEGGFNSTVLNLIAIF